MIFAHTLPKVLDGTKTQTRRLMKANHTAMYDPAPGDKIFNEDGKSFFFHPADQERKITLVAREDHDFAKDVYRVGKTYAVQPGRGQKAVARIRITGIRREDVRNISDADVIAEGFDSAVDFFLTWCSMHDPAVVGDAKTMLAELWERTDERYQAWVLEFELVQ